MYLYHVVKQGETVYSISKNYGIRIDSLLSNNKKIINYHIVTGDTLIVPSYKNVYDFIEYRTVKKESLADIANHFQISLQELKKRNPHLGNNVAKNEVVFIPIQKKTANTEQTETTVSSEVVLDLLKSKDSVCISGWDTKKKYTVALILPFSANKSAATLSSGGKKSLSSKSVSSSIKYISFYYGVTLALDSLAEKGLNIRLNVYDINDVAQMEHLLEKYEMRTTDLIIGIIYRDEWNKIADFSEQYNIPLINVASPRNDILQGYPNVAKIVPDDKTVSHAVQQILPENESVNILIIRRNTMAYNRSVEELKMLYPNYREFISEGKSMSATVSSLDSHKPNFVFMFSENTTEILDLMRVFDEKRKQYDITLIGYPNWNIIEKLDYRYAHNLKLHFIVPQVVDYNEQRVKDFIYMFRARFNSDPDLSAFQGYDITYNFLYALGMFGHNCFECFDRIPHHFLSTGEIIFDNTLGNGYNNQYWNIYTVKEYEIVRIP
jgi:LysM repeat protein